MIPAAPARRRPRTGEFPEGQEGSGSSTTSSPPSASRAAVERWLTFPAHGAREPVRAVRLAEFC